MKSLSAVLAILMVFASISAFAMPGSATSKVPAPSAAPPEWPSIPSPLHSPLGMLLAQNDEDWDATKARIREIDRKQTKLRVERRRLSDPIASLRLGTEPRRGNRYVMLGFDF
jgi:hypothetical protein